MFVLSVYQIGRVKSTITALMKKGLHFASLKYIILPNQTPAGYSTMNLSYAHSLIFTFGWTRFNGFGSFGVE